DTVNSSYSFFSFGFTALFCFSFLASLLFISEPFPQPLSSALFPESSRKAFSQGFFPTVGAFHNAGFHNYLPMDGS
ncbi:hypothetical protein ACQP3C_29305, partial [Escherichia coli]